MLKESATDDEILDFIDQWALLLEKEDYDAAFVFTKQNKNNGWTPEFIRKIIKSYGDCELSQKLTVLNNGLSIDSIGNIEKANQKKEITWYDEKRGDVWYDLNIDGNVSDLTALFDLEKTEAGIDVYLDNIHVM